MLLGNLNSCLDSPAPPYSVLPVCLPATKRKPCACQWLCVPPPARAHASLVRLCLRFGCVLRMHPRARPATLPPAASGGSADAFLPRARVTQPPIVMTAAAASAAVKFWAAVADCQQPTRPTDATTLSRMTMLPLFDRMPDCWILRPMQTVSVSTTGHQTHNETNKVRFIREERAVGGWN